MAYGHPLPSRLSARRAGAEVTLIFSNQKKVIVSAIRGARITGSELPSASVDHVIRFTLDSSPDGGGAPHSFWIDAAVRHGFSFDLSQPTSLECHFSLPPSAPPLPPPLPQSPTPLAPPPAPLPPPANTCPLGLAWEVELQWPGGLRASVVVVVWQPGSVVLLDFRSSFDSGEFLTVCQLDSRGKL